jgi:hypothetical protein
MDVLVSLVKIWRARVIEVIRPILGRGSIVGGSKRPTRRKTVRY